MENSAFMTLTHVNTMNPEINSDNTPTPFIELGITI